MLANYMGVYLTKPGRNLIAKGLTGTKIQFTRVKIGDGQLAAGQKLEDLTDLIAPKKELSISSVKAEGDGQCRVRTHLTNSGLEVGLFVYELGVFALDPDEGEILYGYTAAETPDFLPAEGGTTLINHQFDIMTIVGNATNIEAKIDVDGYVSQGDFEDMKNEMYRILAQMEIDGRVPGENAGNFFDTFDGKPTRLVYLDDAADLVEDVTAGTTELPIVMAKGAFSAGEQVIIMDNKNIETLTITDVDANEITVAQLVHAFKKGAVIARSTAALDEENKAMKFPAWGTYAVEGV